MPFGMQSWQLATNNKPITHSKKQKTLYFDFVFLSACTIFVAEKIKKTHI